MTQQNATPPGNETPATEEGGSPAAPAEEVVLFLDEDTGAPQDAAAATVEGAAEGASAATVEVDEAAQRLAALAAELEKARAEAADFRDRWMRKSAEFENQRKRFQKEREDLQKFGRESLLKDFVGVLDDMERALAHAGSEQGAADVGKVVQGVTMVARKFDQTLQRHGVSAFAAVGQRFDPTLHEALQQVEDASVPQNSVIREFQRGYMLHDRLLRPALVAVARGGSTSLTSGSVPAVTEGEAAAGSEGDPA